MNDENDKKERGYWLKFLNKYVTVSKIVTNQKTTQKQELFYNGVIINVLENKIILDDRKLGETPLSFNNLSLIAINEEKKEENENRFKQGG